MIGAAVLGLLGLTIGSTVVSTVWLARSWPAERARRMERQRLAAQDAADAARRAREAEQVRTTIEELQPAVRAEAAARVERRVEVTSPPRARVLTPALRAIDGEVRLLEALDQLVYDPATWEH